ncbi:hypothetical protein IW140_006209 [Coemansia sp. RSA 1813]|nr:hypothetical protein EV178_006253 [Coemansia sp. RSA 1646]KAJ1768680.1 hypothetical protein LPJ74_004693 [Coemansia sp. RSA 1843]KAJ2217138.1 hypothetical protein EV179_000605 [Coemansia sp. RSA 487]KAJ2563173.1 hypothetical protein IW140_006209 [Coemansia sp. RSA 1813]
MAGTPPGIAVGANIDTVAAIVRGIFTKRMCAVLATVVACLNGHMLSKWFVFYAAVFVIAKLSALWHDMQRRRTKVDWSQHTVLLTGGAHGIGLSLLHRLIAAGARVAIIDIIDIPTELLPPDSARLYKCDLSSVDQIHATLDAIRVDMGDITMLVNNAGTLSPHLLCDMSAADIDRVMGVNLLAPMHLTRCLLPSMLDKPHAHLVFVASMLSFVPAPQVSTYAASKAGVAIFQETLRLELQHRLNKRNVHVTSVYPSKVESGMFGGLELPQWFSPSLSPDLVAHRIFTQMDGGCGGEIHLPLCSRYAALYMLAPEFCRTLACKMFGSLNAMRSYKGYTRSDGKPNSES